MESLAETSREQLGKIKSYDGLRTAPRNITSCTEAEETRVTVKSLARFVSEEGACLETKVFCGRSSHNKNKNKHNEKMRAKNGVVVEWLGFSVWHYAFGMTSPNGEDAADEFGFGRRSYPLPPPLPVASTFRRGTRGNKFLKVGFVI